MAWHLFGEPVGVSPRMKSRAVFARFSSQSDIRFRNRIVRGLTPTGSPLIAASRLTNLTSAKFRPRVSLPLLVTLLTDLF
jgi:hypothetical protein